MNQSLVRCNIYQTAIAGQINVTSTPQIVSFQVTQYWKS